MTIDSAQLAAFLPAVVALVASPGPATLGLAGAGAAFGFRAARRFLGGLLCGAAMTLLMVGSGVAGAILAQPLIGPILTVVAMSYMIYLAYRIATASALGRHATQPEAPGFAAGLLLAMTNVKAYAVFAALFSGFAVIPDDAVDNAWLKGLVIMSMLTVIDFTWLYAGSTLRHFLHDPRLSRRINLSFAVLLLLSVIFAVAI
ncbi:LysE family translocator [Thiosocius teredinicola]|uniref:LysE family translocator n=1 Tax=Thiosocius teredinicola TaxID=1973002 RepID=UPI000990A381